MLGDYRARVQRAAGVEVQAPSVMPLPAYPTHRQRAVPIPDVRGSVWELLFDLPDCELDHLVAERNSILGRHWPASSRFDYELRFRLRLDRCRERLSRQRTLDEAQRELLERLDEIAGAKRDTLPAVWWAVTYDSAEFEQAFSPAAALLRPGDRGAQALGALDRLWATRAALTPTQDGIDRAPLDRALGVLAASRYGGRLLRSLAALIAELDAASLALERARARPLCPQQRPTPRAQVLRQVLMRHYAARVQPYIVDVQLGGRAWLDAHARLLSSQGVRWPAAFEQFRRLALDDGADSLWRRWTVAQQRHVQAWQALLGACGLMPGTTAQAPAPGAT
ncbi:DUF3080 family protein [Sinimarinibacterium thermocellulolyticum]|uniref:DUF3080 family protein n=1 Tax=Sinimarinibacterium thermocellulolyticum TaxID=3170016 RepID=A0ABV2A9I6_9GAMM